MKEESFSLKGTSLRGSDLNVRLAVNCRTSCHVSVAHIAHSSPTSWISLIALAASIIAFFLYTEPERTTLVLSGITFIFPLIIYYHYFDVCEETVSVISGLGLIISTRYRTGRQTGKFIEESKVVDIIINEAITMYRVIFYMAVLVKTEGTKYSSEQNPVSDLESVQLIPLFVSSMPSLRTLKDIYHTVDKVIHRAA